MILKQLYLYPELGKHHGDVSGSFREKTRCICNYIERTALKPLKFKVDGFKRICVIADENPNLKVIVNSSGTASIGIAFTPEEYAAKANTELQEYFITLLVDSLIEFNEQITIPLEEIQNSIEQFRISEYKNEWVHKSKSLKGTKQIAKLYCQLSVDRFRLHFHLVENSSIIFQEEILNEFPDEIVYEYKFKDLIIDGCVCRVTDRFGDVVYEKDIGKICNNL